MDTARKREEMPARTEEREAATRGEKGWLLLLILLLFAAPLLVDLGGWMARGLGRR